LKVRQAAQGAHHGIAVGERLDDQGAVRELAQLQLGAHLPELLDRL